MTAERRAGSYRPLLIGLTGPIGCGKSTVATILGELGGTIIDADVLARRATDPGRATLTQIRQRFGDAVFLPDGELDRAQMAELVFRDADALAELERIVHPEVRTMVDTALEDAAADDAPFVAIEAIKLVEGGLADRCDEVWLVECTAATQRRRLLARGDSEADAQRRVAAQGEDLVQRLDAELAARPGHGPRVRRLSTDSAIDVVRDRAEELLAEAFEASGRT